MFTHIDEKNRPTMVDISDKLVTERIAIARSHVKLPAIFKSYLTNNELILKKGPVIQTAIIAGTMAVKKTSELIPFCHSLNLDNCKILINLDEELLVTIDCEVKTTGKTGVEMEALTGASIAALTIYDMCKAITHDIQIKETKLLMKLGGKNTVLDRPLYGLILTGGASKRMQSDKALINYVGKPHAMHLHDLLTPYCNKVFLSAKENQWSSTALENLATIVDDPAYKDAGPLTGILSAFSQFPDVNWIVLACDLVYLNDLTIQNLINNYRPNQMVTAYRNREKGFAEPLATIYTPESHEYFLHAFNEGTHCPVKILKNINSTILEQTETINLANINTPKEKQEVKYA